ncbi:MAG: response regulator, partial [Acidobacteria bacterium]|nr:response regulator [Acidobacteriota bacterium]
FTAWRPDVLVSDIGMPIEDGYDLIRKIRALPIEQGGNTSAIALTAFAGKEDRQRALAAGFQQHLSKPIEPVALAKVVARILGRSDEGITL